MPSSPTCSRTSRSTIFDALGHSWSDILLPEGIFRRALLRLKHAVFSNTLWRHQIFVESSLEQVKAFPQ
jgi:hypothetical protein